MWISIWSLKVTFSVQRLITIDESHNRFDEITRFLPFVIVNIDLLSQNSHLFVTGNIVFAAAVVVDVRWNDNSW